MIAQSKYQITEHSALRFISQFVNEMRFSRAPGNRTNDLPTSAVEKNKPIKMQIGSEKRQIDSQEVLNKVRMQQIAGDGEPIHNATELSYRRAINTQRDIPIEASRPNEDQMEPTTRAQLNSQNVNIGVLGERQPEGGRKFMSKNARRVKQNTAVAIQPHLEVEIQAQRELMNSQRGDARSQLDLSRETSNALNTTDINIDPNFNALEFAGIQVANHRDYIKPRVSIGLDLQVAHPFSREGRLKLNRQVSEFYSQTGRHMTHEELAFSLANFNESKQVSRHLEVQSRLDFDRPDFESARLASAALDTGIEHRETGRTPMPTDQDHQEVSSRVASKLKAPLRGRGDVPTQTDQDHQEISSLRRAEASRDHREPTQAKKHPDRDHHETSTRGTSQAKGPRKERVQGKGRIQKDNPDVIVIPRDGESLGVDKSLKSQRTAGKVKKTRSQVDTPDVIDRSLRSNPAIEKVRGRTAPVNPNTMTPAELSSDPKIREMAIKEKQRPQLESKKRTEGPQHEVKITPQSDRKQAGKKKIKSKPKRADVDRQVEFKLFDPLAKALEDKLAKAGANPTPSAIQPVLAAEIKEPDVETASKAAELRSKTLPVASEIVNEEQTEKPTESANEASKSTRRSEVKQRRVKAHVEEISTEAEKPIEIPKVKQVFF